MADFRPSSPDRAGVLAPPPLILAGFFAAGWALDRFHSVGLFDGAPWRVAGLTLIGAGGALGLWVIGLFRRAGTAIEPWKATTALVTGGPFRLSRNPTYVALALCHAGSALALDAPCALAGLIPALVVLDIGVVRREERYLAAKFGNDYRAYRARVRRWL